MLTRRFEIMGTFLPCTAILALSAGCSSSMSGSERMTDSRRDAPVTAERHEMRAPDRGDRTDASAGSRVSMRSDSKMAGSNDPIVREPIAATDPDSAMAAEQSERVTMVTGESPPLSRIEVPAHELRDGEFWVAGLWRGESGKYVWQSGRIERDRTGQLYVPANWVPSARGWEYTAEYWR